MKDSEKLDALCKFKKNTEETIELIGFYAACALCFVFGFVVARVFA